MAEADDKRVGKGVFLGLAVASLGSVMLLTLGIWYLVAPRLAMFHAGLPRVVGWTVTVFLALVALELALLVLTAVSERNFLFPKNEKQLTISFLFPVLMALGRLAGFSKQTVRKSFISVNNALVRAARGDISPERVLVLLPQCVQNTECGRRITVDIGNCAACGGCTVGDIVALGKEYGAKVSVATGGTLARKVVRETRPTAILAVACDRDLTSGIQHTHRIPTLGILNRRPHGPCMNTSVDLAELEDALRYVAEGRGCAAADPENTTEHPPLQPKAEGA